MRNLLRRIWYIASGRRQELDLADELAFHREMKAQELRDRGVGAADLDAETRRAMGNDLAERQRSRDVWVWPWLQDISQDVRFGARMLAKDRRFTAAAVLALGTWHRPQQLRLHHRQHGDVQGAAVPRRASPRSICGCEDGRGLGQVSPPDYREWRDTARSFEGLAGHTGGTMNLSDDRRSAERLRGGYVSSNLLQLLRTAPVAGRGFVADDERPGAESVTMLSYEIWQSRYGGEPIIGHPVRVNGAPSTIIGVMPPGFAFPFQTQVWQPLSSAPGVGERGQRSADAQRGRPPGRRRRPAGRARGDADHRGDHCRSASREPQGPAAVGDEPERQRHLHPA